MKCAILGFCLLVVVVISICHHHMQEKQIEELTMYLMKIQDRMELPELKKCKEGQIGILQSEIYKFAILLKEQSEQAKKERTYLAKMLSDISHQIKTPLTAITIMTELLENSNLEEKKRMEFMGKIDAQVSKITWLIRNLLVLSQLEADVLKLKKERVSLEELIKRACHSLEVLAELKGIQLEIEANPHIAVSCDIAWTAEALSNIIKNCVEHTKAEGSVQILCSQNNFSTNIRIKDNGCGISKEDLPHIFERFYKGKHTAQNSVGIGLAMAKQIIMQQNGKIEVSSEEGKGTCFWVKLYEEVQRN